MSYIQSRVVRPTPYVYYPSVEHTTARTWLVGTTTTSCSVVVASSFLVYSYFLAGSRAGFDQVDARRS